MATRKPYPSDVSDKEWAFVAPYLALVREDAPQREHDLREVFDALRWVVRTGSAWRYMPHDLPPWEAVVDDQYRYHVGLEEHDYDGTTTGNWKVEGAPIRNRLYKDIGLKVRVRREDAWVEIGGSAFCLQKNFS